MARSGKSKAPSSSAEDATPDDTGPGDGGTTAREEDTRPESDTDSKGAGTEPGVPASETGEAPVDDTPADADGDTDLTGSETEATPDADDRPESATDPDSGRPIGEGAETDHAGASAVEATPDADHPDPEPVVRASSGKSGGGTVFLTTLLGGLVAGGVGFAAAWIVLAPGNVTGTLNSQSDRIGAIEGQLESLGEGPDLAPLEQSISENRSAAEEQIGTLREDLSGRVDSLSDRIAEVDARLTDLEQRSGENGQLDDQAVAAYEREVTALREEFSATSDRVEGLSQEVQSGLETLQQETAQLEESADQAAQTAATRAAISQIRAALDSGAPYEEPLQTLQQATDVPEGLSAPAADGVPTLSDLQESFPDAARAALSAARAEGVSGESGGLAGFLRGQVNLRSVEAREGDSPDAILSRAGAAIEEARPGDALAEIETLPEVARAEMADWTAAARTRAAAVSALGDVSQSLTTN